MGNIVKSKIKGYEKMKRGGNVIWFGFSAALAALDLGLKELIEEREEKDFPVELPGSKGKIMLHKSHNAGMPFGLLKGKPEMVRLIPVAAASSVFGVLAYLTNKKGHFAEKTALAMILGGAASNIIDRFRKNYVVDYFSFQVKGLKKVIFNLGDMFIFAGFLLMAASEGASGLKRSLMERRTLAKKE